ADDRDAGIAQQAAQLVDELLGQGQDRRTGRTGVDSDECRSCLDGASIVVRLEENTDGVDLRPQLATAGEVSVDGDGLVELGAEAGDDAGRAPRSGAGAGRGGGEGQSGPAVEGRDDLGLIEVA